MTRRRLLAAAAAAGSAALAACGSSGSGPSPSPTATTTPPQQPPTSSAPPTAPPTSGPQVLIDQAYAEAVERAHLLDLYLPDPAAAPGPWPVVLFFPGSAWRSGDAKGGPTELSGGTTAALLAQRWGPLGVAVAGVNVRSSAQAVFPAQVHDAKTAVRYLRSRAAELGLDAGRVATMGTSSGGWCASMTGVVTGVPELEGAELGYADQSSAVQAVVDLYGPTDFTAMDSQNLPGSASHDAPDSPESALMGFPIQSDPVATQRADPSRYVTAGSPPLWIAHGTADTTVPPGQSQLLFAACERAGATATLTLVDGVSHDDSYLAQGAAQRQVSTTRGGTTTTSSDPDPTYDAVLTFLREALG
ncbi:Acetyl esterase/lipase [Quadrisphaera granulorum]|uniref:Acetyl esterase/lipase n=1 Tax=Quadrisphaera granulorum TaxID=317664 RepID=A0A316AB22_9ACTN|nr:alpha/beta hydrolase [Quadrisphaera granulorum]PWJ54903.1 acetyl esterase/lipase [Quadrisphaera granulorum]SZE95849.1 Acetyl esterase/lipase [Quadrisphaera granulorum]